MISPAKLKTWKHRYKNRQKNQPLPIIGSCSVCGKIWDKEFAYAKNGSIVWLNECCIGSIPFSDNFGKC